VGSFFKNTLTLIPLADNFARIRKYGILSFSFNPSLGRREKAIMTGERDE
jgi:hypothetical protein